MHPATQLTMELKKKTKTYLICFNPYGTNRDKVMDTLVEAGIRTWRSEISGCIMLKTVYSADEIRGLLLRVMQGRFIVAEINGNCNGMMTKKGWDFLSDRGT